MKRLFRSSVSVLAALVIASAARADLRSFVREPQPVFAWNVESTKRIDDITVYKLHLVSQMWHGFKWQHDLLVYQPDVVTHPEFCALHNTWDSYIGKDQFAVALAKQSGMTVAVLYGIPMQPIWGLEEDGLIVATWKKYLETGDPTWPLHFPMARAVVKAMDALQQFSARQLKVEFRKFMVNGLSKRGWTSWLVGATGDPRVAGIAPMVIDTLNVAKQIPHQIAMLGKASDQIKAYTQSGMLSAIDTPRGKALMALEDPYSYRNELTLPKLIVCGTNDRYWAQDALNLYWDGLKGPKWVLYDPNSGHGLEDQGRVVATLAAFMRSLASHTPMPTLRWKHFGPSSEPRLSVDCSVAPVSARIWRAESATTDFRNSKWTATEQSTGGGRRLVFALQPAPAGGYAATFAELTFNLDGKPFTLSTQLRILPETKRP